MRCPHGHRGPCDCERPTWAELEADERDGLIRAQRALRATFGAAHELHRGDPLAVIRSPLAAFDAVNATAVARDACPYCGELDTGGRPCAACEVDFPF